MKPTFVLAVLAATMSSAAAAALGFNYGNINKFNAVKVRKEYVDEFNTAKALVGGGNRFTSARLYTGVQGGTTNGPNEAIQAAIDTNTSLLLGLWCSAGEDVFANELLALQNAIGKWGESFARLVVGISVGSEDLYRISPTGIENHSYAGAGPDVIVRYIRRVRAIIQGTVLDKKPVGHVDTWTAWVNGTNQPVIDACDWIGMDAYPYFQSKVSNAIEYNNGLFQDALGQTRAAVGGKPVWITETGFPATGKTSGAAVPSIENAARYWNEVGCPMFGRENVWWYTLQDNSVGDDPSFGVIGSTGLTTTPRFDISCKQDSP
ncbi:glycoside hydrolase superfamily [Podospora australis]|uniref:Probable glucan endo-1,3-beta-glucosidase eglC n=1 Tax=Podospora australis TaxID=1536484 RepID=A0AAN6X496_9PEZI|nr:glycoside hydrolase superfamily [Podospora australis]